MATNETVLKPENASDAVLPPEIFPSISDALFGSGAKRTLLNLICAESQIYALCLPRLMRSVELSNENGFDADRLVAFAKDGLETGKSGHTRRLKIKNLELGNLHGTSLTALASLWAV
jgi:hypothetical protein